MNDFPILLPVYRKKLATWKSGKTREKTGKMIVRKKWPPSMQNTLVVRFQDMFEVFCRIFNVLEISHPLKFSSVSPFGVFLSFLRVN